MTKSESRVRSSSPPSKARPHSDRGGTGLEESTEAGVLVVGLGEVGLPLLEVLGSAHQAAGRDIDDQAFHGVRILHLCFPFGPNYVSAASRYVALYRPEVVVVNSTVVPGTTRAIQQESRHSRRVQPGAR